MGTFVFVTSTTLYTGVQLEMHTTRLRFSTRWLMVHSTPFQTGSLAICFDSPYILSSSVLLDLSDKRIASSSQSAFPSLTRFLHRIIFCDVQVCVSYRFPSYVSHPNGIRLVDYPEYFSITTPPHHIASNFLFHLWLEFHTRITVTAPYVCFNKCFLGVNA